MKKINFCSGPALLPMPVYQQAIQAINDFQATGLSILELSHRSTPIVDMIEETKSLVKELLQINSDYEVLFLHGGASLQFCSIPMNFLLPKSIAYYTLTGQWANNAFIEAQKHGNTQVLCSSAESNYNYLPSMDSHYKLPDASYVHFTSNNTIYGTQWKSIPSFNAPIIVDMSSDILSKKIDVLQYDLIYAGAQKNLGIAGVCLVIIKKELLQKQRANIPTMLDYAVHVKHHSSFNTPPVFAIYTCLLNLKWLKALGGVDAIELKNQQKAAALYQEIDRNSLFNCTVPNPAERSLMNATFICKNKDLEEAFKLLCHDNGLVGIEGYRAVGGFRASMYNAMPIEDVNYLVSLMQEFENKHA